MSITFFLYQLRFLSIFKLRKIGFYISKFYAGDKSGQFFFGFNLKQINEHKGLFGFQTVQLSSNGDTIIIPRPSQRGEKQQIQYQSKIKLLEQIFELPTSKQWTLSLVMRQKNYKIKDKTNHRIVLHIQISNSSISKQMIYEKFLQKFMLR